MGADGAIGDERHPTEPGILRLARIVLPCTALGVSVFTWYYGNLRIERDVLATAQETDFSIEPSEGGSDLRVGIETRLYVVNSGNRPAVIRFIMLFALSAPPEPDSPMSRAERCSSPDALWRTFFQAARPPPPPRRR